MPDANQIPRTPEPHASPGWKLRIESRLGLLDPIQILPFRSFGTPRRLHLRGRVIERKGVEGVAKPSSLTRNVLNTLHRLESDEIPGARLRARFAGKEWETSTDDEGYFVFDLDLADALQPGWHAVALELVQSVGEPEQRFVTEHVLVPSDSAEFAVISDLDDTVIRTHNTDLLQETAIVFGKGASERMPFPGIPALYRALARGPDDQGHNPIFYASKSGWNLYDLYAEFMDEHDLPVGPMFLSDLRVIEDRSPVIGSDQHKFESIDLLIRTYSRLPFILVGDSGMHDPELYERIAGQHPGRIQAVYVHDITTDQRDREVSEIAQRLSTLGIPMLRAQDSVRIAEHAREQGCISERGLREVRSAVARAEERA